MTAPDGLTETRVDDYDAFWEASPPTSWRWHDGGGWMIRPPCGHHFLIGGTHSGHDVEDDGRVLTVEPKPGNSNSILCPKCGWHGYVHAGIWGAV